MRRYSQRQNLSTLSEINVTPLLDLAFVLLIIFIITTPLMDKQVDLVLPTDVAAKNAVDPAAVQTISINKFEAVKLNGEDVEIGNLSKRLADLKKTLPEIAVVIRSHRELPVQKLLDVMSSVQKAQITKVGVVTNPQAD